jgi:predicted pyridoxine 5'-phosphate oxidase superfamily flavin-nucleotide-binding protein
MRTVRPYARSVVCLTMAADAKILSIRRCATVKLSEEAKRIIAATQPAFVATASRTGKPNVSPKGSFKVVDDEHVAFAEIASPGTIANIKENPLVEILVFNPETFGGCRIRGKAEILEAGDLVESFRSQFAPMKMKVRSAVRVTVDEVVIMPPMKAGSK